jgi:hypothetical protein
MAKTYRNTFWMRMANILITVLLRAGLNIGPNALLTVPGRKALRGDQGGRAGIGGGGPDPEGQPRGGAWLPPLLLRRHPRIAACGF